MADMSKVKLYFLEQYNGNGFVSYPDSTIISSNFKLVQIANISGDVVTTSVPHGLYPNTLVYPLPMVLFVDCNNSGSPGSRAVEVLDEYRLRLISPITEISVGQYMAVFRWIERTNLLKTGSLRVQRQDDHSDGANFEIITTSNGFVPYAGMNVLIKYDSGFTLFGGIVRSCEMGVSGQNKGANSSLLVKIKSDTYAVLAKRRVVLNNQWRNVRADTVARYVLDVLKQEGITEGYIGLGLYLEKFPKELIGCFTLLELLDNVSMLCGYKWYINPDKALFFVPQEASYNPNSQAWEPFIGDAPFNIEDGGGFTDYGKVSLSTGIELYNNTIHLEGGLDDYKREAYSLGRDDAQVLQTQLRMGGSGIWGRKIETDEVNFLIEKTVESVSVGGVIRVTAHELHEGDYVFNQSYVGSRVKQVIDADNFVIYGSIGVSGGDIIFWYSQANAIIRNQLKCYGGALPKILEFDTFTIGNEKIWSTGQRIVLDLAVFGEAGKGNYVTDSVEYADIGGNMRIRVVAKLRGSAFFNA